MVVNIGNRFILMMKEFLIFLILMDVLRQKFSKGSKS